MNNAILHSSDDSTSFLEGWVYKYENGELLVKSTTNGIAVWMRPMGQLKIDIERHIDNLKHDKK